MARNYWIMFILLLAWCLASFSLEAGHWITQDSDIDYLTGQCQFKYSDCEMVARCLGEKLLKEGYVDFHLRYFVNRQEGLAHAVILLGGVYYPRFDGHDRNWDMVADIIIGESEDLYRFNWKSTTWKIGG